MSAVRSFRTTRFGSPGVSPQSLGIPAAAYPGRIATNSDLIVAVDSQQTALLLPLTPAATSMTVFDASQIVPYNLLSIDNEIVKTTGPPTGNVVPIARGFDGTAPASHSANSLVSGLIDAWHHNALVSEIEAIETALGPNLTNVSQKSGWFNMAQYNFAPIVSGNGVTSPGGTLAAGNNVVTFAVVPAGVNGTDVQHYLYISGGTGAPEACLITGGSGTAGQLNGQILINCGHAHSGAWSVWTATSGFQEAKVAAGPGSVIFIPGGSWPFYAPGYIDCKLQVIGAGMNSSIIVLQSLTQDGFDVVTPDPSGGNIPVIFRDFEITSISQQTSGSMIHLTAASGLFNVYSELSNIWFEGYATGANLINCGPFTISDCEFHSNVSTNTAILLANPANNDEGDSIIQRNWFLGGGTAINYQSGAGLRVLGNKFNSCQVGFNLNWTGVGGNQVSVQSNNFDTCVVNSVIMSTGPGSNLSDWSIIGNFFGDSTTDSFIKIAQGSGQIAHGVISSNYMINISATGTCINIPGGSQIAITGNLIVSTNATGTVISAAAGTSGSFVGNAIYSNGNGGYNAAASSFYFADNAGLDNVVPNALASASTITFPMQPNFVIQGGSQTITAIVPPLATAGQRGTFTTPSILIFTPGATIGQSGTTAANKLYQWMWDGSKLWVTGPGF